MLKKEPEKELIVTDVDGVLTDGGIYIGKEGEIMKKFSVKDGSAICEWISNDKSIAWITKRNSKIVENRASEIGVNEVLQGVKSKPKKLKEISKRLGYSMSDTVYVGDSYSDIEAIESAGVGVAPSNAMNCAKKSADYTLKSKGGNGAVYELISKILC
jgi:YrbI family 3-deoxy-D-manno-octulosonate 8-phosphate phosphatase